MRSQGEWDQHREPGHLWFLSSLSALGLMMTCHHVGLRLLRPPRPGLLLAGLRGGRVALRPCRDGVLVRQVRGYCAADTSRRSSHISPQPGNEKTRQLIINRWRREVREGGRCRLRLFQACHQLPQGANGVVGCDGCVCSRLEGQFSCVPSQPVCALDVHGSDRQRSCAAWMLVLTFLWVWRLIRSPQR